MTKVDCLKNLLACISEKSIDEITGETVCDIIDQFTNCFDEQAKESMSIKKLTTPTNTIVSPSVTDFDFNSSGTLKKILMDIFHTMFSEDDTVTNNLPYVVCPTGTLDFNYAYMDVKDDVKQYHLRCIANTNSGLKGFIYEFLYTGDQNSSDFPISVSKK